MSRPCHLLLTSWSSAQQFLIPVLSAQGYTVSTADNEAALFAVLASGVDLIILDVPSNTELTLLNQIRARFSLPIIVIGPQRNDRLMIAALEDGADDVVQRPYRTDELLARIRAQLRRQQRNKIASVSVGPLKLDLHMRRAYFDQTPLDLTPTEFTLLMTLALQPGRKHSSRDLLSQAWGTRYLHEPDLLQATIQRLRRSIEADPTNPTLLCGNIAEGYWLHSSA